MKNLDHIGTAELLSLPSNNIFDVPAKADTGADSSAIWASNIRLDGEELVFNFFAQGSAFYNGALVRTGQFRITRVRNSFGQEEHRYKVKLKARLGKNLITCWFSLADRSGNTYPILLGKNFLKNRFMVDVSRKNIHNVKLGSAQVCVLSNKRAVNQEFFDGLPNATSSKVEYSSISYGDLWYHLEPHNVHIDLMPERKNIGEFDLVYLKTHEHAPERAAALADYLRYRAVRFVGEEITGNAASGKLSEGMRLCVNGLPLPTTISASSGLLATSFAELKKSLGLPFVLKESASNRGKNNYLIKERSDFERIIGEAPADYIFIVQCYIPNDGFLRIVVMGRRVVLSIKRHEYLAHNPLKAHLNNKHYLSKAELVPLKELSPEAKHLAIRVAAVLRREVAGVDLVQDKKTKKWYILEVNNSPQLRSGPFLQERIEALNSFINKELIR